MKYIFDYVEEKKDIDFNALPLTEVDNIVFSRIIYLNLSEFKGKTLNEIAKNYNYTQKDNARLFGKTLMMSEELLKAAAKTKRYENIVVADFKEISNANYATSFYGAVFKINSNVSYIAFRGTDDTIMSFYEDAELAYSFPIPSQVAALQYTRKILDEQNGKFYIGGHSKGGNLALFTYVFLNDEAKERIIKVFNNDGPGFPKDVSKIMITPEINEKVETIVPEDSIVGRLLDTSDSYTIIKSSAAGGSQHNVFTWIIDGDKFERAEKFGAFSEFVEDRLTQSLDVISLEEIKKITEKVYNIALQSGIESTSNITLSNIRGVISELREMAKKNNDSEA